jgi:hypothetical protein
MGPMDMEDRCDVEPWEEGESYPIELYENTDFEAVTL